ncbi:MAG: hypothetical protein ACRYG5_19780, partial [Janthinobacterium lividum]
MKSRHRKDRSFANAWTKPECTQTETTLQRPCASSPSIFDYQYLRRAVALAISMDVPNGGVYMGCGLRNFDVDTNVSRSSGDTAARIAARRLFLTSCRLRSPAARRR